MQPSTAAGLTTSIIVPTLLAEIMIKLRRDEVYTGHVQREGNSCFFFSSLFSEQLNLLPPKLLTYPQALYLILLLKLRADLGKKNFTPVMSREKNIVARLLLFVRTLGHSPLSTSHPSSHKSS